MSLLLELPPGSVEHRLCERLKQGRRGLRDMPVRRGGDRLPALPARPRGLYVAKTCAIKRLVSLTPVHAAPIPT